MNDRKSNYLRHCPKQTLQRAECREGRPIIGEGSTQHHKHGDHLRPQPDWQTIAVSVIVNVGEKRSNLPTICFNERNSKNAPKPLQ